MTLSSILDFDYRMTRYFDAYFYYHYCQRCLLLPIGIALNATVAYFDDAKGTTKSPFALLIISMRY